MVGYIKVLSSDLVAWLFELSQTLEFQFLISPVHFTIATFLKIVFINLIIDSLNFVKALGNISKLFRYVRCMSCMLFLLELLQCILLSGINFLVNHICLALYVFCSFERVL